MKRRAVLRTLPLAAGGALAGCTGGVGALAREGPPEFVRWCYHPRSVADGWREYGVRYEEPTAVLDHRESLSEDVVGAVSSRYRRDFADAYGLDPASLDWTVTAGLRFAPGPEVTVASGSFDREGVVWTLETDPMLGYRRVGTARGDPLYASRSGHAVDDGRLVAASGRRPVRSVDRTFAVRAGERPTVLADAPDRTRLVGLLRDATVARLSVTPRTTGTGWRSWGYGFDLRGSITRVVEAMTFVEGERSGPTDDPASWTRYTDRATEVRDLTVTRDGRVVVARGTMDTDAVDFRFSPFSR